MVHVGTQYTQYTVVIHVHILSYTHTHTHSYVDLHARYEAIHCHKACGALSQFCQNWCDISLMLPLFGPLFRPVDGSIMLAYDTFPYIHRLLITRVNAPVGL